MSFTQSLFQSAENPENLIYSSTKCLWRSFLCQALFGASWLWVHSWGSKCSNWVPVYWDNTTPCDERLQHFRALMQQTFISNAGIRGQASTSLFICILISSPLPEPLTWWMIKEAMEETLPLLTTTTQQSNLLVLLSPLLMTISHIVPS